MNSMATKRFGSTSLFLAWRFFAGRERNALVSFISAVSIFGLALAIALLIVVLSVMNGFEKEFRDRILGLAPHATLWFDQPVEDWQSIVESLEGERDIIRAQPIIEFKAMAVAANQVRPILIQGVDYPKLSPLLQPYLGTHQMKDLKKTDTKELAHSNIFLGVQLATQLGLEQGDNIRLMVPDNSTSTVAFDSSGRANSYSFQLSDTLITGTEIDNVVGLISLRHAAAITHLGNGIQGIQLQVVDLFQARRIATLQAINHQLPVRITDWTQSFGNLYTAIQLSRQMVVLLLTTIIAVAVFNVFVTLGMVVKHKKSDIAILRTMGFTRRGVLFSFVMQGMLIASIGCIIGALFGSLLAYLAPSLMDLIEFLLGVDLLRTDVYPINYLPSQLKVSDIALVCLAALGMSFLATLYPAWRAANILPATTLRYA